MKLLPLLVVASVLWTALPAAAQAQPGTGVVQNTDPDILRTLVAFRPLVGFVDANTNGRLDLTPDEPAYFDLDESKTVSYGDMRFTHFLDYAPTSLVDLPNRDFGLTMVQSQGWFARAPSGLWYVDIDDTATVTTGDVRVTGPQAWTKVAPGAPDASTALTRVQGTVPPGQRVGYLDENLNNRRDADEAAYVDLTADQVVSPGDIRIVGGALAPETAPTRGEFDAAVAAQRAGDAKLTQDLSAAQAENRALREELGNTGFWLTVVGLVVVVGLIAVAWYARSLFQQSTGASAPSSHRRDDSL